MIDFTKFFKLKKPDVDEFYDVALNNENMDIVDAALEELNTLNEDKANGNSQTGDALNAEKLGGVISEKYASIVSQGNWNPVLGAIGATTAPTYNTISREATYKLYSDKTVKLFLKWRLNITNAGTTTAVIKGLPFVPTNIFGVLLSESYNCIKDATSETAINCAGSPERIAITNVTGGNGKVWAVNNNCWITLNCEYTAEG